MTYFVSLMLSLLLMVFATRTRAYLCFLNKTTRFEHKNNVVGSEIFCGCTGMSSDGRFAWNVLLPPHAGTITTVKVLAEAFESCKHEHTFEYLHEKDVERFKEEKCGAIEKTKTVVTNETFALKARCSALERQEMTVALVRNPYLRVLSGASYRGRLDMSQPQSQVISSFRRWVQNELFMYIAPVTAMLTSKDGSIVRPTFVIKNGNPEEYNNGVLNLLRVLGASQKQEDRAKANLYNPSFSHHTQDHTQKAGSAVLSYKSIPVHQYFSETEAAIILQKYKHDFKMFNLETNVSSVEYIAW